MANLDIDPKFQALLLNLPDPTGTLSLRQRLEIFFFGGLVTETIPDGVCPSLRLQAGQFDSPAFLNSVSFMILDFFFIIS